MKASAIVARSVLPSDAELAAFRATLEANGKAFVDICGEVCVEEKVACEYSITVCAFKPRKVAAVSERRV